MAGIIETLENREDCAITDDFNATTPALDFVSDNVSVISDGQVKEGARNDTILKTACNYFRMGLTESDVELCTQNFNMQNCKPPLPESEVKKTVESASRYRTKVVGVTFPPIVKAITDPSKLPELQPELIQGVLRKGAYMALVGASKMGKSFLLIDLAVCIQNGLKWLGFQCAKGRVLYINLEIEENSFMKRVNMVYQKYEGFEKFECFDILNLRGYDVGIEQLEQKLDTLDEYDLFIIDPQYKVNSGDENSASEQGAFFNHIDHIATTHTTSIVICHHHSKNDQTSKRAIDRGSGSGVFGRAVDALLDITEVTKIEKPLMYQDATAIVLTPELRDFPKLDPVGLWWQFPFHYIDEEGVIIGEYFRKTNDYQNRTSTSRQRVLDVVKEMMNGKDEINSREVIREVESRGILKESQTKVYLRDLEDEGFKYEQVASNCSFLRRVK